MGILYLSICILFNIFAQEIGALKDDITNKCKQEVLNNASNEVSDLHVRKKRLIDRTLGGNRPVPIENVPYIVNIQEDGVNICSGSILLANVILTTAFCVIEDLPHARYVVLSGSPLRYGGIRHRVLRIRRHPEYEYMNQESHDGNLALLTIFPHIDLIHSVNKNIPLHNGPVLPNTLGSTSGWGRANIRRRSYPIELRSITVPIISIDQCRREHNTDHLDITNKFICTHDRLMERHSSIGDEGNPLVAHRHLIGVMIWTRDNGLPDVYINLSYPTYKAWIVATLLRIATNPP